MLIFIRNHLFAFKMVLLLLLILIIGVEIGYTRIYNSSGLEDELLADSNCITIIDSHGPDTRVEELESVYFNLDGENVLALVDSETIINKVGLEEGIIEYDVCYTDSENVIIKEIRY